MKNEIKISAPQDTPERNTQVIAWANRQGQIERSRYHANDASTRPLGEKLRHYRWLIWGVGAAFITGLSVFKDSVSPNFFEFETTRITVLIYAAGFGILKLAERRHG